jgi:hypothetical protein
MRKPFLTAVLVLGAMGAGAASGVTQPGRTRVEAGPITVLSVTSFSVVYAVADNAAKTDCAHVYLWHTAGGSIGKWRFGKPTNEPCSEGPSTGSGVAAVAMSAGRALWIQYAGGNLRDYQLFTATRTKTSPKQLAFAERGVDAPAPIVVGKGTRQSVPYAIDTRVTLLGDNGAAVFKWTAPSAVRRIASGAGPGGASVAVFLASGEVDLLSSSGMVVGTYSYQPDAVTAMSLAPAGLVVQVAGSVEIRKGAQTTTVALPAGAQMFDYGQGRIYYTLAGAVHALKVVGSVDSLLVASTPGKTTLASYATAGGFAWAVGNKINWDCAGCVVYSP